MTVPFPAKQRCGHDESGQRQWDRFQGMAFVNKKWCWG